MKNPIKDKDKKKEPPHHSWRSISSSRVIRGGSWYYSARLSRVSFRGYTPSDRFNRYLGFRIVRTKK